MGYLPLGIAFGVYSTSLGFPLYVAPLTALVVYAGSVEFLLLGMVSSGASLLSIAASTLLVNSRHVLFAISYPRRLLRSTVGKFYGAFSLTDEAYALVGGGFAPRQERELLIVQGLCQLYWVGGTFLGAAFGSLLPPSFDGFDFSLTGLFVLLAVGAVRSNSRKRTSIAAALASILVGLALPKQFFLLVAMTVYTALCLVAANRQKGAC